MKKIVKSFLLMAVAAVSNISFAQNVADSIPYCSGIHRYSMEVKKENNTDSAFFYVKVMENKLDPFEVKNIFYSKFTQALNTLEKINETSETKKEGVIVVDEYGRRVYFAVVALKDNEYLLLEGGEVVKGIFYPNIIKADNIRYKEDKNEPGTYLTDKDIITFKVQ